MLDNPDFIPPETGLAGHPRLSDEYGKGWLRNTNAKLDAWLKKRGLNNERTTPYGIFGEYGKAAPRDVSEQVPDVDEVPDVGKRRRHKRGNGKGNKTARRISKPNRKQAKKRKT